jgi:hypothetical protein
VLPAFAVGREEIAKYARTVAMAAMAGTPLPADNLFFLLD